MSTLQQQILSKFLERLSSANKIDPAKIAELRKLMGDTKKLKAEDFVRIFSHPAGGDVK